MPFWWIAPTSPVYNTVLNSTEHYPPSLAHRSPSAEQEEEMTALSCSLLVGGETSPRFLLYQCQTKGTQTNNPASICPWPPLNWHVWHKSFLCVEELCAHVEITNPMELVRWRAVSEKRSYGNQDHQENSRDFPGDSVVKNSPANEGDVG